MTTNSQPEGTHQLKQRQTMKCIFDYELINQGRPPEEPQLKQRIGNYDQLAVSNAISRSLILEKEIVFFVKPDFHCSSRNMSQFWILEDTKQFFTSSSSIFPTAAVDLDRDIPLQALVQWKCIILLLIRNVCPHLKIDCAIVEALWITKTIPGVPNTAVLCHIQFIYQQ